MTNAFSIRDLGKTYPDFTLGPLNLDLAPGTVLGYVGPNGSGKSTTLHCLVGLVKEDGGEMQIFNRVNVRTNPTGSWTSATSATCTFFTKTGRAKKISNSWRSFTQIGRTNSLPI